MRISIDALIEDVTNDLADARLCDYRPVCRAVQTKSGDIALLFPISIGAEGGMVVLKLRSIAPRLRTLKSVKAWSFWNDKSIEGARPMDGTELGMYEVDVPLERVVALALNNLTYFVASHPPSNGTRPVPLSVYPGKGNPDRIVFEEGGRQLVLKYFGSARFSMKVYSIDPIVEARRDWKTTPVGFSDPGGVVSHAEDVMRRLSVRVAHQTLWEVARCLRSALTASRV